MSDPLAIAGAGLGLIGGVVGARGSAASSEAQAAAAEFNREIGIGNAVRAGQVAEAAGARLRYGGARLTGAQRAGYAAAGIDVGSGSPGEVAQDTASQLKLADLVRFYQGEVEGAEEMNRAELAARSGEAVRTANRYSQGAALLGGLGTATNALSRVDWGGSTAKTPADKAWWQVF